MKIDPTPGPWTVVCGEVYSAQIRIAIMDRDEERTRPTERDANARLIAAAPELLEALKDIVAPFDMLWHCGDEDDERMQSIRDRAEAAIRKAEGETS